METKTIHALLLSIVVMTGAMTIGNAYAQTNTDRLIQVVENTNLIQAIADTLDEIADSMADLINSIAGVGTAVDGVADSVSNISSNVDSISTDLEQLSSDVQSLADGQADIQDALTGAEFNDALSRLSDDIKANSEQISNIENSLGMIQASLTELGATTKEISQSPPPSKLLDATTLSDGDTTETFNVATFGHSVPPMKPNQKGEYEATMSFSCEEDVYLDQANVMIDPTIATDIGADGAAAAAGSGIDLIVNIINGAERLIYNDKFNSGTQTSTFTKPATLNGQLLSAGDKINFKASYNETVVHTDGTLKFEYTGDDGTTRATPPNHRVGYFVNATILDRGTAEDKREIFTLKVDWQSNVEDPKCSIEVTSGSGPERTKTGTVLLSGPTESDGGEDDLIRSFDRYLNCTDVDSAITGIQGVGSPLANIELVQIKGDGKDTIELNHEISFNATGLVGVDFLPLEIPYGNLTISSSVPNGESILLQIEYETVPGDDVECTIHNGKL